MSLKIGVIEFDKYEGQIEIPKLSSQPYSTSGNPYTGAHLQPPRPEPFTLRCWYHDDDVYMDQNQRFQLDQIGKVAYLIANDVTYALPPYRLKFFVVDVRIVEANLVIHASGNRGGVHYTFTPASRVISDITLLALPLS